MPDNQKNDKQKATLAHAKNLLKQLEKVVAEGLENGALTPEEANLALEQNKGWIDLISKKEQAK